MKCNNLIWIVYIKSELKTAEGDNFFAEYCYGADGFRSGKKVNGVSTGRPEPGYYIPKGKEYEEKINIARDLVIGWAKDFSETTYVDDPQDPNVPDDDTMYFNSMADAAAA